MNRLTVAFLLAAAGGLAGTASAAPIQINGAGATFPNPIYSKWFSEYNKLHPDIQINYQPIGSGGGIRQLTNQTVFFGATDGPMTNDQIQAAGARVLHLPTVLTKWNDPAMAAENPGVSLPGSEITVVHRSDGSGTSYIWADYLAKVSPEWSKRVGVATAVNWPVGVGGKGNEGVAGLVKQTPNSIGYVELIYALQNKIPYGAVKNAAGNYLQASIPSVTAAAAATEGKMPPDFRVSITNAPGKDVYPIASFTWLLLYESAKDKARSQAMVDFVKWALSDGQKYASDLGYAPLPASVVKMELAALGRIK